MRTLAMIKMEKNFIAVIEKKYPRKPYETFTIGKLIDRLEEEYKELVDAYLETNYSAMLSELADVSNLVDFIFEQVMKKFMEKPE